jgi:hypothetical protein
MISTSTFRLANTVEIIKTLSEGWRLVPKYLYAIRDASIVTFGRTSVVKDKRLLSARSCSSR